MDPIRNETESVSSLYLTSIIRLAHSFCEAFLKAEQKERYILINISLSKFIPEKTKRPFFRNDPFVIQTISFKG
jgi:hypothetical protein